MSAQSQFLNSLPRATNFGNETDCPLQCYEPLASKNSVQMPCCRHFVCLNCLRTWTNDHDTCPFDRSKLFGPGARTFMSQRLPSRTSAPPPAPPQRTLAEDMADELARQRQVCHWPPDWARQLENDLRGNGAARSTETRSLQPAFPRYVSRRAQQPPSYPGALQDQLPIRDFDTVFPLPPASREPMIQDPNFPPPAPIPLPFQSQQPQSNHPFGDLLFNPQPQSNIPSGTVTAQPESSDAQARRDAALLTNPDIPGALAALHTYLPKFRKETRQEWNSLERKIKRLTEDELASAQRLSPHDERRLRDAAEVMCALIAHMRRTFV